MMNWKNLSGLVFLAAGMTHAHLSAGSLLPAGGETLTVGQSVSITWNVEEIHNQGIDIAFSKDGGSTWTNIKTGFTDTQKSDMFKWTVPGTMATANGKFRICQSGPCTDQNASKPGGESPWILVSGALTVKASTAIASPAGATDPISLDFNPETRNVDVTFGLAESRAVLLQAFDTQGRLLATLIQGNYGSGTHTLSVFSNRLGAASGSLVFKLKAGDQVKTHTWMSLR